MGEFDEYDDRLFWVKDTIGGSGSKEYVYSFCEKILPGFLETGTIPKNRLKYVSIPVGTNKRVVKRFLTIHGVKHRGYIMGEEGYEILLRKDRYMLYKISISKDIFDFEDFEYDVDLNKLNEKYKEYAKTKTKLC